MADYKDTQTDQVHGKVESTASGEGQSEVCEPCKVDNNIQPAVGWCETCDEKLCNDCYKHHCRATALKTHKLMSIVNMTNMKQRKRVSMKCDKHEGKPLEYFCEDHAELGCSPCFVTKHRSCSKVVYIADVKTKESGEFKTLETLWSQFETRLKRNEEMIEDNLGHAARQHDKAIAGIKEAGEKLKAHIDALVKEQILQAEKMNEENIKNMRYVEETKTDIANKLKSGREMLSAEISDNDRLFVTIKSLLQEANVLKSMLDQCVNRNKVNEYEFELSPELAVALEKVQHFGALKDKKHLNVEKATDDVVDIVEVMRFQQSRTGFAFTARIEREAIRVSTDHDIRLLNVLAYACTGGDTEVSLFIGERGNCLIRCNSAYKREADQQVVAVNVTKEGGAHGITLQAGHQYIIGVTRPEKQFSSYYSGTDELSTVTEKGVTVTFTETISRGVIIAGLRFTII